MSRASTSSKFGNHFRGLCDAILFGCRLPFSIIFLISATSLASPTAFAQDISTIKPYNCYAGWVVRVVGKVEFRLSATAESRLLTTTNARGTLLFVSSELRCESNSSVVIQLPWTAGITNVVSTNWLRLQAPPAYNPKPNVGADKTGGHGPPKQPLPGLEKFAPAGAVGAIQQMNEPFWVGPEIDYHLNRRDDPTIAMLSIAMAGLALAPMSGSAFISEPHQMRNETFSHEIISALSGKQPDFEKATAILSDWKRSLRHFQAARKGGLRDLDFGNADFNVSETLIFEAAQQSSDFDIELMLQAATQKARLCCRNSTIDLVRLADAVFCCRYPHGYYYNELDRSGAINR